MVYVSSKRGVSGPAQQASRHLLFLLGRRFIRGEFAIYKACLTVVRSWDVYACVNASIKNIFLMITYLYKRVLRVAILTGIIVKRVKFVKLLWHTEGTCMGLVEG